MNTLEGLSKVLDRCRAEGLDFRFYTIHYASSLAAREHGEEAGQTE
jgi:hypothetical protein